MSIDLSKYAGHTPGPWVFHQYGVRDAGGYLFKFNWPHLYTGQDERYRQETAARQADGCLIADAPALLAALAAEQARAERLAEALRVIAEYQPQLSNTWNQDIDAIRHLARAALALRPSGDGVG